MADKRHIHSIVCNIHQIEFQMNLGKVHRSKKRFPNGSCLFNSINIAIDLGKLNDHSYDIPIESRLYGGGISWSLWIY